MPLCIYSLFPHIVTSLSYVLSSIFLKISFCFQLFYFYFHSRKKRKESESKSNFSSSVFSPDFLFGLFLQTHLSFLFIIVCESLCVCFLFLASFWTYIRGNLEAFCPSFPNQYIGWEKYQVSGNGWKQFQAKENFLCLFLLKQKENIFFSL